MDFFTERSKGIRNWDGKKGGGNRAWNSYSVDELLFKKNAAVKR